MRLLYYYQAGNVKCGRNGADLGTPYRLDPLHCEAHAQSPAHNHVFCRDKGVRLCSGQGGETPGVSNALAEDTEMNVGVRGFEPPTT